MRDRPLLQSIIQTRRHRAQRGFTLIELLTVLGISAILLAVAGMSFSGLLGSQKIDGAASELKGLLELAHSQALAGSTYVWLGLFEESPSNPGQPGTGQLVCGMVSSSDGTQLYSGTPVPAELPASGLTQVRMLTRIGGVHLLNLQGASSLARGNIPEATDEVGEDAFAVTSFQFPPGGATQYTFTKIIQFGPQGTVTRPGDGMVPVIEIALGPANGSTAATNSKNLIVLQIGGMTGAVTLVRP